MNFICRWMICFAVLIRGDRLSRWRCANNAVTLKFHYFHSSGERPQDFAKTGKDPSRPLCLLMIVVYQQLLNTLPPFKLNVPPRGKNKSLVVLHVAKLRDEPSLKPSPRSSHEWTLGYRLRSGGWPSCKSSPFLFARVFVNSQSQSE